MNEMPKSINEWASQPFKFFFILLMITFLTACETKEEILIKQDGSLSYIQISTVDRKMMDAMKSMGSAMDMIMAAQKKIVKKYETIDGVKYASIIHDASVSNKADVVESRIEIEINHFMEFPEIQEKIKKMKLSNKEMNELFDEYRINDEQKSSILSGIETDPIINIGSFHYDVKGKFDDKYRIQIEKDIPKNDMEYDEATENMMKNMYADFNYSVSISVPSIIYTNMELSNKQTMATLTLNGSDYFSKDKLNGLVDFELGDKYTISEHKVR